MTCKAAHLVLPTCLPSHSPAATVSPSTPLRLPCSSLYKRCSNPGIPFLPSATQLPFILWSSTQHPSVMRPHLDSRLDQVSQVCTVTAPSPLPTCKQNGNNEKIRNCLTFTSDSKLHEGRGCVGLGCWYFNTWNNALLTLGSRRINVCAVAQGADSGCCPVCVLVGVPFPSLGLSDSISNIRAANSCMAAKEPSYLSVGGVWSPASNLLLRLSIHIVWKLCQGVFRK